MKSALIEYKYNGKGKRSSRRKKQNFRRNMLIGAVLCVAAATLFFILRGKPGESALDALESIPTPEWIDVQLIDIDGAARRGEPLEDIRDIVIHYVGNPGTTASQNRSFFNNPDTTVSSHFVVGLDGEIIKCVPLNEKSSASNWRNSDTISIEVCHPDKTGEFTKETYASLVRLTAWLCEITGLGGDNIIRHYDITGKECPLYFVKNPDEWLKFKSDVLKFEEDAKN